MLVIVKGNKKGDEFCCGLSFEFNPLTCMKAPPKVESLFFGKTIEACERIAKQHGFSWEPFERYTLATK